GSFLGAAWHSRDAGSRPHGEGQHDERNVTMPAVPRAALVVVEAEFVLGRLETILDRPAVSFDLDQGLDARSVGTPGGEEGHIVIGDVAADQQTPCPETGSLVVIF